MKSKSSQTVFAHMQKGEKMGRLIDAIQLKISIACSSILEDGKTLEQIIDEQPTIEQELIRCKDCKWYGRADKRRFYRGMDCLQKRICTIVPDSDFCSRAERREDGM